MKAHTRWLGCKTCGVLRDHVLDTAGLTPFDGARRAENWICTLCGTGHLMAPPNSDHTDRERLERLGQMRLID